MLHMKRTRAWLDATRRWLIVRIGRERPRRWRRLWEYAPMLGVFALAFLVRLVFNLTVAAGYQPLFDAGIYNTLALNLLHQHCYCLLPDHLTAYRPPFWPLVIAVIYTLAGEHTSFVRMLGATLGTGTCVLVYVIARDLFGRRIALVTGMLAAVYAGLFIWDGWLYSESLYILLQVVFLFSLIRMQRDHRRRWIVLCGVALGLAALTRPTGMTLLGLLVLWVVLVVAFRLAPWRRIIASAVVAALLALAIMTPWTLYTARKTHSLLPPSNLSKTLAGSYNDMVARHGDLIYGLWWLSPSLDSDFHDHTAADEQALAQRAFTWIKAHPDETRALLWAHLTHMWTPYFKAFDGHPFDQFPNRPATVFVRDGLLPPMSHAVFLLATLGLIVTWRRRWRRLLPVYLAVGLTILENVAFYGAPRLRAPIEPLLVLLVGGLLWAVVSSRRAIVDFALPVLHRGRRVLFTLSTRQ
jgi:Dolichyl-phosphate-mannose-protein mannosyltransferase